MDFRIEGRLPNGRGRAGVIETPHGIIETPAFIPVGTKATVKALSPEQLRADVGAHAVLANTYHLYLQPGHELIARSGGLGRFMDWSGPTFTDSGGFQAFSLQGGLGSRKSKFEERAASAHQDARVEERSSEEADASLAKVDEEGVTFKSVIDGTAHRFTPERSIEIQHAIGADIIFTLDDCAQIGAPYEAQKAAVERTSRWARRCLEHHESHPSGSALFGIVQGGKFEDLRRKSAADIGSMGFAGFGIGGTFEKTDMATAVGWVCDALPEGKPRHLLGIGEPEDLILGIENGADTFDCVAPTRLGRNGAAYTSDGRVNLLNARFVDDLGPLDRQCGCYTCRHYTRAYLSHLFRAKEMLAATLASIHNLYFLVDLAKQARAAILSGTFEAFKSSKLRAIAS